MEPMEPVANPRRSGPPRWTQGVQRRDVDGTSTTDTRLLDNRGSADWLHTDPWRVLRIQSEFVDGFGALAELGPAVTSAIKGGADAIFVDSRQFARAAADVPIEVDVDVPLVAKQVRLADVAALARNVAAVQKRFPRQSRVIPGPSPDEISGLPSNVIFPVASTYPVMRTDLSLALADAARDKRQVDTATRVVILELAALSLEYDATRLAWQLAVDAAGVGAFDWNLETRRLQWDERLLELFGYDSDTFGSHIDDFNRKVRDGVATEEIEYLAADDEDRYVIAQANARVDDRGRFLDEKVLVRARRSEVAYVDPH